MINEKTFGEYVKIMSAKTNLFWHQLPIFVLFIYINIKKSRFYPYATVYISLPPANVTDRDRTYPYL